jgi:hypothetical protein
MKYAFRLVSTKGLFMKKVCFKVMFIVLLSIGMVFLGCDMLFENIKAQQEKNLQQEESAGETVKSTDTGLTKTYKKMALLQTTYAQKGVDIVEKYLDIPDEAARSARDGVPDLDEIGRYLPDDLTVLKRIMIDTARNGMETEISLQDELDALVDNLKKN